MAIQLKQNKFAGRGMDEMNLLMASLMSLEVKLTNTLNWQGIFLGLNQKMTLSLKMNSMKFIKISNTGLDNLILMVRERVPF